jgi:uncharacterized protein YfdQ (DUF2303 family)
MTTTLMEPEHGEGRTESDALIELALAAKEPIQIADHGHAQTLLIDGMAVLIDYEKQLPAPARGRGTVHAHSLDAVGVLVGQYRTATGRTVTYADHERKVLTTVLDDHLGSDSPGWQQWRIVYQLKRTPAWEAWRAMSGNYRTQAVFAEFIEDHVHEITDPDAGDLFELAQTFHAAVNTEIRSARRLSDGRTNLVYSEDVVATGGTNIEIPARISFRVPMFEGAGAEDLTARFRWRRQGTEIVFGLVIDRPDEREREAFDDIIGTADERFDWPVVEAAAP